MIRDTKQKMISDQFGVIVHNQNLTLSPIIQLIDSNDSNCENCAARQ